MTPFSNAKALTKLPTLHTDRRKIMRKPIKRKFDLPDPYKYVRWAVYAVCGVVVWGSLSALLFLAFAGA